MKERRGGLGKMLDRSGDSYNINTISQKSYQRLVILEDLYKSW